MKYLAMIIGGMLFGCAGGLLHLISTHWSIGVLAMLFIYGGLLWFRISLEELKK